MVAGMVVLTVAVVGVPSVWCTWHIRLLMDYVLLVYYENMCFNFIRMVPTDLNLLCRL